MQVLVIIEEQQGLKMKKLLYACNACADICLKEKHLGHQIPFIRVTNEEKLYCEIRKLDMTLGEQQ